MNLDRQYNVLLMDYYGTLLTNHQNEILDEYYNNDLSMNEIADNYSISKAAVQDLIKRSLEQLHHYENHLHLIEKDKKFDIVIEEMKATKDVNILKYVKKLEKIK